LPQTLASVYKCL